MHGSQYAIPNSRRSNRWYVERVGGWPIKRGRRQRSLVDYSAAFRLLQPVRYDLFVRWARLKEQVRLIGGLHVAPESTQLGRDPKVPQRTCRDPDVLQFRQHDAVEVGRVIVAAEITTTAGDQVGVETM